MKKLLSSALHKFPSLKTLNKLNGHSPVSIVRSNNCLFRSFHSSPSTFSQTPEKNVISEQVDPEPINNNTSSNSNNSSKKDNKFNSERKIKVTSKGNSKFLTVLKYVLFATVGSIIIFVIYESNNEQLNYYVSPTKVLENREEYPPDRKIRVGGIVKEGTIKHGQGNFLTVFTITDLKYDIVVEYKGVLPDLFQEESTVICEGFLVEGNTLKSTNILAKHDQRNGMPPEIAYEVEKNRRELERKKLMESQNENAEEKTLP